MDFTLGLQTLSENVVVQGGAPLLQTATAEMSDAVVIPPGGTRGEALQHAGPLYGNPNFGRIFSAKAPHEMQFGLRFTF